MADGRWAAFGSSTQGETNDDWADFGGFESAAPVANSQASSDGSGLISWAAAFPTSPATTALPTTQETLATTNQQSARAHSPFTAAFPTSALKTSDDRDQMSQSSSPADPPDLNSLLSAASPKKETVLAEGEKSQVNEQLSSVSSSSLSQSNPPCELTLEDNFEMFLTRNMPSTLSDKTQSSPVQVQDQSERSEECDQSDLLVQPAMNLEVSNPPGLVHDSRSVDEMLQQVKEAEKTNTDLSDKADLLQEKLSFADREKIRIQQDLEDLMNQSERQKQETEDLKESLQNQKEKYSVLQDAHEQQLRDIQQAGHEALTIIVQEYKELTRKAVLEQQENNKICLQKFLDEEREKFQQLLKDQQESFEQVLCEEKEKNAQTLQEALEQQKETYRKEIESCLEKEREHSREMIEKAVQECQLEAAKAVSKAVEQESEKQKEIHETQKAAFTVTVEDMKAECRQCVESALHEEQKRGKEAVQEAMIEERDRGKEVVSQAVDLTKQELLEYRREKERADSLIRQKHFTAMDLFLESARCQLKVLMEAKEEPTESLYM